MNIHSEMKKNMNIKIVKARTEGRKKGTVVLTLTGLLSPDKEYAVRKYSDRIVISDPHGTARICANCNTAFDGDIIGDLCESCEKSMEE